jgi:hypothetical protein
MCLCIVDQFSLGVWLDGDDTYSNNQENLVMTKREMEEECMTELCSLHC